MYKRIKAKKLGRKKSHREAMMNNQLKSLFTYGAITTTTVKAKALKSNTERVLADIKNNGKDPNIKKKLTIVFGKDELVKSVLEYGAGKKATVSIVKVGFRDGDQAEISKVMLADFEVKKAKAKKTKKSKKPVKATKKDSKEIVKEKIEKAKEKEKSESPEAKQKKGPEGFGGKLSESIKGAFKGGSKERAKSRSGI